MKKWLLILGMITCMIGLTACGQQKEDDLNLMTTEEAEYLAQSCVELINQIVNQQGEKDYVAMIEQSGMDGTVFENAFASWKSASEDMGSYVETIEVTSNTMVIDVYQGVTYPSEGVITVKIKGEERDATVEIVFEDEMPSSITTNVEYTFGEKMEKAGLNTLLGMGTVFIVLILISAIISCFNLIPKIEAKFTKKPVQETRKAAVVSAPAQEAEEELSDDLELVAVISAAIAASEGAASADGYVVRSIKRAGNKWQRA